MLDFLAQLRDALADRHLQKLDPPAEVDDAAREAAFAAAVALGRCRASGQELPPDLAGTLDGSLALAAAEHGRWLVERLQSRFLDLFRLSDRVDIDSYADQDTRCWIVLARHDLWAATGAIQDADDALTEDGESLPALTNQLISLIENTAELDSLLLGHTEEFTEAGTLPLLVNLRSGIGSATENLPWWLDGTIEATSQRAMESFLRSLPDPLKLDTSIEQAVTVPVMRISGVRVSSFFDRLSDWMTELFSSLVRQAAYSDDKADEVIKTFPSATTDAYSAQLIQDSLGRWFLRVFTKDEEAAKLKLRLDIEPEAPEMQFIPVAPAMFFAEVRLSESMAQALRSGHRPVFRATE